MQYELNLSAVELETRTKPKHFRTYRLLDEHNDLYQALAENDKKVIGFLIRAADLIEEVNYQLDHPQNLPFLRYLQEQIKKGDSQSLKVYQLFTGQKGINGFDSEACAVQLLKEYPHTINKGFYPLDLSTDMFHTILIQMLEAGKKKKVQKILNQRSVVVWDHKELKGIDYVDYFSDYFKQISFCLSQAAQISTNDDFNHFLRLQAQALLRANPLLDAWADKKWASLQETPLEFTIVRENDGDEMTPSVFDHPKLRALLLENKIDVFAKDSLGGRVGIVNPQGTKSLLQIKQYLPLLAQKMPYNEEYEQNITQDVNQTMVDVDLVVLTGTAAEYRGSITVAENLPNNDKLSLKIGGGRRNVYHRQIRMGNEPKEEDKKRFLDKVLVPEQQEFVNLEADHLFTICHENAHSLGPSAHQDSLGKFSTIIEEAKADMGALVALDTLVDVLFYTPKQRTEILITTPVYWLEKSKPVFSDAHGVRAVMQLNYFIEQGAIEITSQKTLQINEEKMGVTAQKMLADVIRLQLDGDIKKAEQFIDRYFVWTKKLEQIGKRIRGVKKVLNGGMSMPLADKLLTQGAICGQAKPSENQR